MSSRYPERERDRSRGGDYVRYSERDDRWFDRPSDRYTDRRIIEYPDRDDRRFVDRYVYEDRPRDDARAYGRGPGERREDEARFRSGYDASGRRVEHNVRDYDRDYGRRYAEEPSRGDRREVGPGNAARRRDTWHGEGERRSRRGYYNDQGNYSNPREEWSDRDRGYEQAYRQRHERGDEAMFDTEGRRRPGWGDAGSAYGDERRMQGGRGDRGFFERAGDEMRSWFRRRDGGPWADEAWRERPYDRDDRAPEHYAARRSSDRW